MAKIDITQIKSRIGSSASQRKNLDALGLRKIHQTVQHEDSPIILGMVEKVKHLVVVAPAKEDAKVETKQAETTEAPAKAPAKKTASTKKSVKTATENNDGTK